MGGLREGAGESARFLTVLFPHDQMQILAYNRALKDLNGHSHDSLLEKLKDLADVQPGGNGRVSAKHELGLLIAGQWYTLRFRSDLTSTSNPIEALDVSLLQNHILAPLLGIDDPRTSSRIRFESSKRCIQYTTSNRASSRSGQSTAVRSTRKV